MIGVRRLRRVLVLGSDSPESIVYSPKTVSVGLGWCLAAERPAVRLNAHYQLYELRDGIGLLGQGTYNGAKPHSA